MSKNVINCSSLDEFKSNIEMYLGIWIDYHSVYVNRSEITSDHGIYLMTVLDVHNTSVVYKYVFSYDSYLKTMVFRTELAHFE